MTLFDFVRLILNTLITKVQTHGDKPICMSFEGKTYDIGGVYWDHDMEMFIIEEA